MKHDQNLSIKGSDLSAGSCLVSQYLERSLTFRRVTESCSLNWRRRQPPSKQIWSKSKKKDLPSRLRLTPDPCKLTDGAIAGIQVCLLFFFNCMLNCSLKVWPTRGKVWGGKQSHSSTVPWYRQNFWQDWRKQDGDQNYDGCHRKCTMCLAA